VSDVARRPLAERLSRPIVGFYVLVGVTVILVLVLIAAYHGSSKSSSAGECRAARPLLSRTASDVHAASSGPASAVVGRLQKDDDDLNNFINGAQHPDPSFTAQVLPVAGNLGRVVTDLQASPTPASTDGDLATLTAAVDAATRYCGV
jgi:hypothetical protein